MRPKTLTNTKTKVNHQNCTNKHAPPRGTHPSDARNHYPITKHHTPPPRRGDNTQTIRVLPQDPIVCRRFRAPPTTQREGKICCCAPGRRHYSARPLTARVRPDASTLFVVLLRKEVIQPHLPVRLPCYDFVPIADPTFDSSPHKG